MRHFSCMIATVSSLNHHNQASQVKDVSWVCLNVKELFCHPAAQYHRRRRTALWVTISLLTLGLLVLTVGLISATRTDNVAVVGLYPGIIVSGGHLYSVNVLSVMKQTFLLLCQTFMCILTVSAFCALQLSFGAFLGIVGIHLVENRRPMVSVLLLSDSNADDDFSYSCPPTPVCLHVDLHILKSDLK